MTKKNTGNTGFIAHLSFCHFSYDNEKHRSELYSSSLCHFLYFNFKKEKEERKSIYIEYRVQKMTKPL